jgi:hypothetical protein
LLPEGLPEWYAQRDANGDGQVMMHEFAVSWSDRVVRDFQQFDLNRDGVITAAECVRATEAGAVMGAAASAPLAAAGAEGSAARGSTSSRSSSSRPEPASSSAPTASASSGAADSNGSDVSARYVKYAVGYIRRYDENKDGVLTKEEWSKMSKDYSAADTDKDGKITPRELAAAMMNR